MIYKKGHLGLYLPAKFAGEQDIQELFKLARLFQKEMTKLNGKAIALAANQVMCNTDTSALHAYIYDGKIWINADYKAVKVNDLPGYPQIMSDEGCMSDPCNIYEVKRYSTIALTFYEIKGQHLIRRTRVITGYPALVHQHEIDHLQGICIFTKGKLVGVKN